MFIIIFQFLQRIRNNSRTRTLLCLVCLWNMNICRWYIYTWQRIYDSIKWDMHLSQRFFSKRLRQEKHTPARISTPRGHFPGLLFRKQYYRFTYPLKILRWKLLRSSNHGAQIMPFFTVISQSLTTLRCSAFISETRTVKQAAKKHLCWT